MMFSMVDMLRRMRVVWVQVMEAVKPVKRTELRGERDGRRVRGQNGRERGGGGQTG